MLAPMFRDPPVRSHTVASLARYVGGRLVGDPDRWIGEVADLHDAGPAAIGFVANAEYARLMQTTAAGAVLVRSEFKDTDAAQIIVERPQLAFARIVQLFHPPSEVTVHEVHPTAVIHPRASLEAPLRIGPYVCVDAGTTIGRGTILDPGVVIGKDVTIGRSCHLYPRVIVYDGIRIGDSVIVHAGAVLGSDGFGYAVAPDGKRVKFPQIGTLIIGNDVEIGANTTLDRAALAANDIGAGSKIDNLCHIGHNCSIGANSAVAALSAFAGGTRIGDRVTVAGHVVSGGNLRVADDVVIGGNSVLTADVPEPGEYAGYPLQRRARAAKTVVLHGRLVEMREDLNRLRRIREASSEPAR